MSHDDEFAFMTMNCEEDIDLTMRAPYIPMNESDDLPLLTEDLMWSAFSDELQKDIAIRDVSNVNNGAMLKESTLTTALDAARINTNHHLLTQNDFKTNRLNDKGKRSYTDFINGNERLGTSVYSKNCKTKSEIL